MAILFLNATRRHTLSYLLSKQNGAFRLKATVFLFLGLRYTDQNFKVRQSEKKIKIKTELQPKTYKFTTMSEALFQPMTYTISNMYI